MSLLALILIIISAFMHATWNYLAKSSGGGVTFVWLYLAVSTVVYAPFVASLFIIQTPNIGWLEVSFIAGSGLIHLAYAVILQRGYKIGDLSLIYPIARGTGPMLVAITAFFIFNERLHPVGIIGVCLILISVFIITGGVQALKKVHSLYPVYYGLLIGVMIAGYTLVDKGAVSVFMISPLLINYGGILAQLLFLTPLAKKEWAQVRKDWNDHRKKAIGVGVLNPLAYILILVTMIYTPVSYVAPVRELSILIGAIMGTYLLKEGFGRRRIIASVIMTIGIVAVALF